MTCLGTKCALGFFCTLLQFSDCATVMRLMIPIFAGIRDCTCDPHIKNVVAQSWKLGANFQVTFLGGYGLMNKLNDHSVICLIVCGTSQRCNRNNQSAFHTLHNRNNRSGGNRRRPFIKLYLDIKLLNCLLDSFCHKKCHDHCIFRT
jgi:hypothetical protein